jgi:hypothetical protein
MYSSAIPIFRFDREDRDLVLVKKLIKYSLLIRF